MNRQHQLAARFAEISSDLLNDSGEAPTFEAVVRRAVGIVPGCDQASITSVGKRGRAKTVAVTDPICEQADGVQYELGEGPCLDAAFARGIVVVGDVRAEARWPRWAEHAADLGVGAVVSIRLHAQGTTLGALNLYSSTRGGFDDDAVDVAVIFAAHATEALSHSRQVAGLEAALDSRHLIGMAQGVLAVKYDLSYEAAFEVLRRYSQDTNTKLRDVAAQVVATRDLPGSSDGG